MNVTDFQVFSMNLPVRPRSPLSPFAIQLKKHYFRMVVMSEHRKLTLEPLNQVHQLFLKFKMKFKKKILKIKTLPRSPREPLTPSKPAEPPIPLFPFKPLTIIVNSSIV